MEASAITSQRVRAGLSWDHLLVLSLAFLIAQASVMYTCYQFGHVEGVRESGGFLTEFPYTLNGLHVWISLGLVLCTISLWFRRVIGLITSSAALLLVSGVYGFWHFRTLKYLSEFAGDRQAYDRLRAEVGFFHGATKWDLLVLSLVALLLLWHLVTLVKMTLERRRTSAAA